MRALTLGFDQQQVFYDVNPHGLLNAGSMAPRPRPLERLSSTHSADDSSGVARGAAPGRPAGSIPLAAPGPSKMEEEVQEKVPAHTVRNVHDCVAAPGHHKDIQWHEAAPRHIITCLA